MELDTDPNHKHKIPDPQESNLSRDVDSLQNLCNLWYHTIETSKNNGINDLGWCHSSQLVDTCIADTTDL